MTYLYLIRHARSTWNAEGRMQGQADPPLDELGEQQAHKLSRRLTRESIQAVYSSPLVRARRTAEAIARPHGLPVRYDARLMERHLGDWTGLTGNEADERYPGMRAGTDWRVTGPPAGESLTDLSARTAAALEDILSAHPAQRVVVVSHGGALNAAFRHLLGLPPHAPVHFHWGNTTIARLRFENGEVSVLGLGDDRHLYD